MRCYFAFKENDCIAFLLFHMISVYCMKAKEKKTVYNKIITELIKLRAL